MTSLHENLQWFNANPTAQITIEGHCDERGTAEYNLALGNDGPRRPGITWWRRALVPSASRS
ncbi:MAG: hypothetical protein M5R38_17910 [Candidatus Methylomirabilis sp.]|nr:hypothetical protein [Candidatus Methylomirabilis sp.]